MVEGKTPEITVKDVRTLLASIDTSSVVGLRKPDPAIYRYACDALGVEPQDCLYCGDGAYRELTGAQASGMTAVEIRDPAVDVTTLLHLEGDDWTGAQIADLRELLDMV